MAVPLFVLKGKILFFIFGKIQRLGLRGNALEGVVAEFPAVGAVPDDSLFGAEQGIFPQPGAIAAVMAGLLHLFAKQHV